MSTYTQVQSRIQDDLNRTDINSRIQTEILNAIKHYSTYPTWFNETISTLSASQAYVAYPTDFIVDDQLYIVRSSVPIALSKWPFKEVFDYRPTTGGQPSAYCIYGGRIEFNRSCDVTYVLHHRYIKELATLSAGSDTNEWTQRCEDLIVARAEKVLYRDVLKDMDKAAAAGAAEQAAFRWVMGFRDNQLGAGHAQAHYL